MKVHITLVGGQPAPVYHGIIATDPDLVVYVYSSQSKKALLRLESEVKVPYEHQEPLDATDPFEIMHRAIGLAEKYKDDEVTLNISSGLKSWSHLFGKVFDMMPNASVVYMDQNNVLWNYRTMQSSDNFVFNMDTLFRLQGNGLEHYTPFADYTDDDFRSMQTVEQARNYQTADFNALTTVLPKAWSAQLTNQKSGRFEKDNEVFAEWEKGKFVRLSLKTKKYGIQEFYAESPHAVEIAFNSGWFEYKVARMLSHWHYATDIRLNCVFPPISEKNKNIAKKFPKNEVDVIVNTGKKILFVECKTKISNSTDIDKFRTVVKNYGGMGSKALFITLEPMTKTQMEKCAESSITYFSLKDPDFGPNKEQELFKLLESFLFNINDK